MKLKRAIPGLILVTLLSGCAPSMEADVLPAPVTSRPAPVASSASESPATPQVEAPDSTLSPEEVAGPGSAPSTGDVNATGDVNDEAPAVAPVDFDKKAAWDACLSSAITTYDGFYTEYSSFDSSSVQQAADTDPGIPGVVVTINWIGDYKGSPYNSKWVCLVQGDPSSPSVISIGTPEAK
ncbi:hypothetical protein ACEXQE_15950 [Herbiconiux sp. P17]|uniref:hypothetical protein n=1 Tax=Herbiconiux wuyangfengii TaxID=3342794 RepID=UPI0035B777FB